MNTVPPIPIFPAKRGTLRLLPIMLLILACLGMARLQLWRAETRGERFEREQAVRVSTPVRLSAQQRERDKLLDRAATARGIWLADKTLFVDNKIYRSRPGYHVLTPLQLSASETVVLVNRGWIPAPRLRSDIPLVSSPPGQVEVSGVTRSFETKTFELKETLPTGPIWQHVREADYRRRSGLDALPVILLQTGAASDGMVRDWGSPENPANRHYGYAVMWLVFALMAAVYGVLAWKDK
jgi:surfeit locus 1 family protein